MKNKEFYAYCRDNRSKEPSLARREALYDVYNFMRECGVTKKGVTQFIDRMMRESRSSYNRDAYQWLLSVFEGPSPLEVSEEESAGQLRLFEG